MQEPVKKKSTKKYSNKGISLSILSVLFFTVLGIVLYQPFNEFMPNFDWTHAAVIGSEIGAILTGLAGFIYSCLPSKESPGKGFSGGMIFTGVLSFGTLVGALFLDQTPAVAITISFIVGFIGYAILFGKHLDSNDEKAGLKTNGVVTSSISTPRNSFPHKQEHKVVAQQSVEVTNKKEARDPLSHTTT